MALGTVVAYAIALSFPLWLVVEEIMHRGGDVRTLIAHLRNPVAGRRRAAPVRLRDRKTV